MVVPDAAVYAALPVLGGATVWIGRQFVLSVTNKKSGMSGDSEPEEMSVKSYHQLMRMFRSEFDNRYMSVEEARTKFSAIESKIDIRFSELKDLIQRKV